MQIMNATSQSDTPDMNALLAVIRELVGEIHPHWKNLHFLPDTQLERELGLDSMARVELQGRIEQALHITLPENAAVRAATADDLMHAITHPAGDGNANDIPAGSAADLLMGGKRHPAYAVRMAVRSICLAGIHGAGAACLGPGGGNTHRGRAAENGTLVRAPAVHVDLHTPEGAGP